MSALREKKFETSLYVYVFVHKYSNGEVGQKIDCLLFYHNRKILSFLKSELKIC
jgi:hypothetical protein